MREITDRLNRLEALMKEIRRLTMLHHRKAMELLLKAEDKNDE
jgi:hypothetical protein